MSVSGVTTQAVSETVQGTFSTMALTFFASSIEHMFPWLIVMSAVVFCDLICGIRRCVKSGTKVRFSKAVRDTMGKLITYGSFVIMVTLMNTAAGGEYDIDKWSCLLVCFIEMCSILSNILKPHGYSIDFVGIISLIFKKYSSNLSKSDLEEAIKEEK